MNTNLIPDNLYLLDALHAVDIPISIYDKDARLLFCNTTFRDYLRIKDMAQAIGREISYILKENGVSIQRLDDKRSPLKMYDVIKEGKAAIDYEVRIEYPDNTSQIVSNDMYPVKNSRGEVTGMIEILRSRKKDVKLVRKMIGLSADYTFQDIIGTSQNLRATIEEAKKYADSPFNLLITGESGVGKELFAHSVHNYSARRNGPFVALNCASFPENLIESELFGYIPGAFTGASKNGQIGKFELSDGGTLFLDEIGELPFHFQSKLLRVLETWSVTRIGSSKPINVNVRLVAATNRDLNKMVEDGLFRQDLYYRLQVLSIDIPPLRYRKDDIVSIAETFLQELKNPSTAKAQSLDDACKQLLTDYGWPGNVRELRNVINRASILAKGDVLTPEILQSSIYYKKQYLPKKAITSQQEPTSTLQSPANESASNLSPEKRLEIKRQDIDAAYVNLIKEALQITDDNRSKAAEMLGVSRKTFYRMLEKYHIK